MAKSTAVAGSTTLATDALRADHRSAERLIRALYRARRSFEKEGLIDTDFFRRVARVLETLGFRSHQQKEHALLEALERLDVSTSTGPIAMIRVEHQRITEFYQSVPEALALYEAGDRSVAARIVNDGYFQGKLLSTHLCRENEVLFVVADQTLSAEENRALLLRFEEIDREVGAARLEEVRGELDKIIEIR